MSLVNLYQDTDISNHKAILSYDTYKEDGFYGLQGVPFCIVDNTIYKAVVDSVSQGTTPPNTNYWEEFKGSGNARWGSNLGNITHIINKGIWWYESLNYIIMGNGNGDGSPFNDNEKVRYPVLNLDGDYIKVWSIYGNSQSNLFYHDITDPVIVDNVNKIPVTMEQGDMGIITDYSDRVDRDNDFGTKNVNCTTSVSGNTIVVTPNNDYYYLVLSK